MLVSHRHRFIYTKTVKTASTSVESYFERYCMPEGEWEEAHSRDMHVSAAGIVGFRGVDRPPGTEWFNHMEAIAIKEGLGAAVWDSYLKFCVVRDPFDKAVSAFYHFGKDRERRDRGSHEPPSHDWAQRPVDRVAESKTVSQDFEDWLKAGKMVVDRNKYLIEGSFCVDEIIRYEALHDGMRSICEKIGTQYDSTRLPEFKRGLRDPTASLAAMYTPASIAIVADLYEYELRTFGYTAPLPTS